MECFAKFIKILCIVCWLWYYSLAAGQVLSFFNHKKRKILSTIRANLSDDNKLSVSFFPLSINVVRTKAICSTAKNIFFICHFFEMLFEKELMRNRVATSKTGSNYLYISYVRQKWWFSGCKQFPVKLNKLSD